jgi:hypothetical protein
MIAISRRTTHPYYLFSRLREATAH